MDVFDIFAHLRGEDGQWSGWERSELSRLKSASVDVLENQVWEDGVTDSGDPWIVAVDERSLELSLHVARLNGVYVAVSGDLLPVASGANLKSVVNDCLTYIRSNRQEAVFADGATIRMPVGVSATAFGIFLTERMATFDRQADRVQTDLEVSNLGPDTNESFVFLSSLATSPGPYVDNPAILSQAMDASFGPDQIVMDVSEHSAAIQLTAGEPPDAKRKLDAPRETAAASLEHKTSTDEKLPAPPNAETGPTTDIPPPETDVATAEAVPPADGGGEIIVAAPAEMIVGEDKAEEEESPAQPDRETEVVLASASAMAAEPSFISVDGGSSEYAGDVESPGFASLVHPPLVSGRDYPEMDEGIWPEHGVWGDVFAV